MKTGIVFPHQLFEKSELIGSCGTVYLVEESLYCKQFLFHKQKIAFHRASMKFYEDHLRSLQIRVVYVEAHDPLADVRNLIIHLKEQGIVAFDYIDTTDRWLEQRIERASRENGITPCKRKSPLFLNDTDELQSYFGERKKWFQTDFYKHQRQKRNILLDADGKPIGGKWTFDDENRLKYPKGCTPPDVAFPVMNRYIEEAHGYVAKHFPGNYGNLSSTFIYPVIFDESKRWLDDFFSKRFSGFGAYEDAIVGKEAVLHHSVLTPMLNVGLLTPHQVIDASLQHAMQHEVPINSLEGFIRQIVGWREFIRAVYELKGGLVRTRNYWGFNKKIPESFWNGTTGIKPLDMTIRKVLDTGYCHHIERLMVIGNFMLLCEFDPDEVYRWFMELFIDAYDWVMVPNVYGMSQFADGGMMSTKPYISGSNYIMKMSDHEKGDWQKVWDGLFWRFMHVHRDFFMQNPRLGMLVKSFDKLPHEKRNMHLGNADRFLDVL
jgi:deoxyribodipyrimidine photolyase-related protein